MHSKPTAPVQLALRTALRPQRRFAAPRMEVCLRVGVPPRPPAPDGEEGGGCLGVVLVLRGEVDPHSGDER